MALSDLLPWNWGSGGSGGGSTPTVGGYDESMLPGPGANYAQSTPAQDASALSGLSSGGMNWAGLSQGLGKLSDALTKGSGQGSGSDQLSKSESVSGTVSGGTLTPQGAGGGASALASMLSNREQLGQYVLLSALQGKGRGRSGQGLLG